MRHAKCWTLLLMLTWLLVSTTLATSSEPSQPAPTRSEIASLLEDLATVIESQASELATLRAERVTWLDDCETAIRTTAETAVAEAVRPLLADIAGYQAVEAVVSRRRWIERGIAVVIVVASYFLARVLPR